MKFTPNKAVRFTTPTVTVDAGSLASGRHRFQLVVENARGQKSQPVEVIVDVIDDGVILRRVVEPRAPVSRPLVTPETPRPVAPARPAPPRPVAPTPRDPAAMSRPRRPSRRTTTSEPPTTPERSPRRRSAAKGTKRPKKRGPS